MGRVGYTESDLSSGPLSASDDGYLLTAGVRGQMSQFEMEGHLVYTDLSDGGDETAFEFAAVVTTSPRCSRRAFRIASVTTRT